MKQTPPIIEKLKSIDKRTTYFLIIIILIILTIIALGFWVTASINKPLETSQSPTGSNVHTPQSNLDLPIIEEKPISLDVLQTAQPAKEGNWTLTSNRYNISGRARVYTTSQGPVLQIEGGYKLSPKNKDLFVIASKEQFNPSEPSNENSIILGDIENYTIAERYTYPEDYEAYNIITIYDEGNDEIIAFATLETFDKEPVTEKNIPINQ